MIARIASVNVIKELMPFALCELSELKLFITIRKTLREQESKESKWIARGILIIGSHIG